MHVVVCGVCCVLSLLSRASSRPAVVLLLTAAQDMGGTELLAPLAAVLAAAPVPQYTRQVFVLTDGEVVQGGGGGVE